MAVLALGASADGYTIEKVWEINNPQQLLGLDRLEIRQGFGMNGKFYVNSKKNTNDTIDGVVTYWVPTIYEIDENGLTGVTFPGGKNCGISRDEAGNILVSLTQFPNTWSEGIRVINPNTGEYVDYDIPEDVAILGRCDFLSFAKGNLMEDGEIWLTGSNQGTGFSHIAIAGGEVDVDNCYYMAGDGIMTISSVVINPYTDVNGEDALLYWSRNDQPRKLLYADDQFTASVVNLENHSNTNGMFPLIWDNKELFIFSTKEGEAHYYDGFAIAESGGEPIVTIPPTTTTVNGFQSQWLNAEVDADGVTIYQYFPGNAAGHFTVWRLTKDAEPEIPNVYMLGGDDQPWNPTTGTMFEYDAENKVYTATITFPAEFNYFGFTTELAENNDEGGWAYIEPFRFGAVSENDFIYDDQYDGQPLAMTWDNYHAYRIEGGEYKLTINLDDMTLVIERTHMRGDVNGDKSVSIADVTALIDYLLSGSSEGVNTKAADCNLDEGISIADVTTLIDFLLSGEWPE